jgi:hypothetical protein
MTLILWLLVLIYLNFILVCKSSTGEPVLSFSLWFISRYWQYQNYIESNDTMTDELRIEKHQLWPNPGTTLAFAWRHWGNPWKTSVMVSCILRKIQSEHLPNACLSCYHYTNLLSVRIALLIAIWLCYTEQMQLNAWLENNIPS